MNRKETLEIAQAIVCGNEKTHNYGSPEDNFAIIADLWSDYLGYPIRPQDVPIMMILLKVARLKKRYTEDSFIDICGYAACGNEISSRYKEKEDLKVII